MSWVLEYNNRMANMEIVLRYHKPIPLEEIRRRWRIIRKGLGIMKNPFIAVIELTRGKDGRPNNCVHYHFLFDTRMDRNELKEFMKIVCLNGNFGRYKEDFELIFPNTKITCYKTKIKYFTKFGMPERVILFRKGPGIRKFYYSKDWFVDQSGNTIKREHLLKKLKNEYKRRKGYA